MTRVEIVRELQAARDLMAEGEADWCGVQIAKDSAMKAVEHVICALDILNRIRKNGYQEEANRIGLSDAVAQLDKAVEVLKRGCRKAG